MIEGAQENIQDTNSTVTADSGYHNSGYHNNATLNYLEENEVDAYIADKGFRARDPRFKDYTQHKPKDRLKPKEKFAAQKFKADVDNKICICPAGNAMWLQCVETIIGQNRFMKFQAYEADCRSCSLRKRYLKSENQKSPRQVAIRLGMTEAHKKDSLIEQMKDKIDSVTGRFIYSQRLGAVEPVFGHITDALEIKRFTLRGKQKVDGQWKLMTMLYNMKKIHQYAYV